MRPAFYKRFHVFVFREICVSRGGPPQHQAREAWEFSHFPKALARLVLRHAATARKTAPLQKLKRSFGLRSVRGIVVAPWRWRRVFRSATDREGPCLGPRARPPTPRRPAGPARKIHTPPPSLDPSGLIQTLTARSPPLTPPYNAPTTLPNPGRLFALPTSGVRRKSGHNKILHPQPPATEDPQDSGALDAYCEP